MACRMPSRSRLRNGLIGASLILTAQRYSASFCLGIGRFNQTLFSPARGSWTVTGLPARLRTAVPVGHQVRVLPKR
jgi:hypothetical protein